MRGDVPPVPIDVGGYKVSDVLGAASEDTRQEAIQPYFLGKTLRVSSRRGALGGLDDEDWADDYHNEALRDDFEDDFDFEGTKEGEAPQTASTSELDPSSPPEAIPPHLAQLLQVPDSAIPIENAASVKFGKDIPPPEMQGRDPKSMYNAATLAYLGDAVWELFLRRSHVGQPLNLANYRMKVQRQACAEAQAKFAKNLLKGKRLNKIEESIFKWGKNSRITIPTKYNNSRGRLIYTEATALEALIGYLYLTDPTRLLSIMSSLGAMETD
eukprot:jgi/Bigna1/86623/estExt_fgenesh1_pg.C_120090